MEELGDFPVVNPSTLASRLSILGKKLEEEDTSRAIEISMRQESNEGDLPAATPTTSPSSREQSLTLSIINENKLLEEQRFHYAMLNLLRQESGGETSTASFSSLEELEHYLAYCVMAVSLEGISNEEGLSAAASITLPYSLIERYLTYCAMVISLRQESNEEGLSAAAFIPLPCSPETLENYLMDVIKASPEKLATYLAGTIVAPPEEEPNEGGLPEAASASAITTPPEEANGGELPAAAPTNAITTSPEEEPNEGGLPEAASASAIAAPPEEELSDETLPEAAHPLQDPEEDKSCRPKKGKKKYSPPKDSSVQSTTVPVPEADEQASTNSSVAQSADIVEAFQSELDLKGKKLGILQDIFDGKRNSIACHEVETLWKGLGGTIRQKGGSHLALRLEGQTVSGFHRSPSKKGINFLNTQQLRKALEKLLAKRTSSDRQ